MFKRLERTGVFLFLHRSVFLPAALLYSVFVVAIMPAGAEAPRDRESVLRDLKQVRSKLDIEERKLTEVKRTEAKLRETIEKLKREDENLAKEEATLQEILRGLERDISVSELQTEEAKVRTASQQKQFNVRMVSLYKAEHRASTVSYLSESGSMSDLLRRAYYMSAVARYDRGKVDTIIAERATLDRELEALSQKKQIQSEKLEQVARLEAQIEKRKREQSLLLKQAEGKKEEGERSLGKLTDSAAQLEKVLASLMGSGESQGTPLEDKPLVKGKKRAIEGGDTTFRGAGLASLEGKLPLPVSGTLVQHFGKQRHEDFGDVLFVKGLEFASTVGAKVTPVAKGKVILSQHLPGFGNVVIVDHGSRYYTLYGRLASALSRPGDLVSPGDTIGILGEADHRGRNFYFELRFKGQPVDPRSYFRSGALS